MPRRRREMGLIMEPMANTWWATGGGRVGGSRWRGEGGGWEGMGREGSEGRR